jgi:transposase InsO family protein
LTTAFFLSSSQQGLQEADAVVIASGGPTSRYTTPWDSTQKNVLNQRNRWATRDELRIEIVTWIERTYHQRRRQPALGRMTPIEYEMIMTPQTATAA